MMWRHFFGNIKSQFLLHRYCFERSVWELSNLRPKSLQVYDVLGVKSIEALKKQGADSGMESITAIKQRPDFR
jgi:hypothetical protein